MKNIHLLPTPKPSRLVLNSISNILFLTTTKSFPTDIMKFQNIYITSDEEIKEGDYAYHKTFGVGKIININGEDCFVTIKLNPKDGSITTPWKRNIPDIKKIILTTDQDLIKDGVQAIPDEFLEWFVKNPSCEDVKVEGHIYKGQDETEYKTIIPKEEPKQETLEEAKKYAELSYYGDEVDAFVRGVKWQKEQEKNKYSEEDMRTAFNVGFNVGYNDETSPSYLTFEKWINGFKKK